MWATLITLSDLKTQLLPQNRDPWNSRKTVMKKPTKPHSAVQQMDFTAPITVHPILRCLLPSAQLHYWSLIHAGTSKISFFSYLSATRHKGNIFKGKSSSGLNLCVCVCPSWCHSPRSSPPHSLHFPRGDTLNKEGIHSSNGACSSAHSSLQSHCDISPSLISRRI